MKLKTIKDFKGRAILRVNGKDYDTLLFNELKAEAINDYKEIKEGNLCIDVFSYIKWKFNLTEEDLK